MLERLVVSLAAAGVGWCLGWASARGTEWLAAEDCPPQPDHRLLVADWQVQLGCALAWAAAPLVVDGAWWHWAAAGTLAVPLVQITVTDLRYRYVYTLVALVGVVLGVGLGWLAHGGAWWLGLVGAAGGFVALGAIYLLGRVLYPGGEPLARGDVTIAAMVGASVGACTGRALVLGILLGGVFAIGVLLVRRSRNVYFAYGPGLCLGGLLTLFFPC